VVDVKSVCTTMQLRCSCGEGCCVKVTLDQQQPYTCQCASSPLIPSLSMDMSAFSGCAPEVTDISAESQVTHDDSGDPCSGILELSWPCDGCAGWWS